MNKNTRGIILIVFVMFIWGSSFTVTKLVVTAAPPLVAAAIRNIIACMALLPFYLLKRKKVQQPLPYKKLVLMGLVGVTFYYLLFNTGMKYIAASTGALIEGLVPVAIAVPAALILKEQLSKRMIAGIFLSVTGVILVGFVGVAGRSENALLGSACIVGAVCLWSTYTLLSRSLKNVDTTIATTVSMFIGTLLSIPLALWEINKQGMPEIALNAWLGITYLGIFASAVAYFLYNKSLESLPAAFVGNFLNLIPVIGAVIAFVFLKDTFTWLQLAGGILVLAGIWLSSKKVN